MRLVIFALLLLPMFMFGQNVYFNELLFPAATDTTANFTSADTIDWRVGLGGTSMPAWTAITNADTISQAEKKAETTLVLDLSNESDWTWGEILQVRIRNGSSIAGTKSFKIGHLRGSVTLFIKPDTTGTITDYSGSRIGGN